MRYSLYLHGHEPEPQFVQTAHTIEALQKNRDTLCRWVSEMGIEVRDPKGKTLVIYDNGTPLFQIPYASLKRVWVKF